MIYKLKFRMVDATVIAFIAVVCFLLSCSSDNSKDHSLSIIEYRNIGMPNPGNTWRSNDVSLAFAVLENLQSRNPEGLPLIDSKKSGELFERMFSSDNMTILTDTRLSVPERLSIANSLLNVCENWFSVYIRHRELKGYYQDELAAILLYGLGISEQMVDISNSLTTADEPDDEYVAKVRSRYLAGLFGILIEQQDVSGYSDKNIEDISKEITMSIDKNKNWMNSITKEDLKRALTDVCEKISSKRVVNEYSDLMEKL